MNKSAMRIALCTMHSAHNLQCKRCTLNYIAVEMEMALGQFCDRNTPRWSVARNEISFKIWEISFRYFSILQVEHVIIRLKLITSLFFAKKTPEISCLLTF